MLQTLPNFIVVGAMRCGTTSLARYLGAHPDVFMARQKEVRYFSQYFDRGIDWYSSQFSDANGERAVGEATPYLHDHIALARMAETMPDVRLVAILRNPVDRAYSHYWLRRARKKETAGFDDLIAAEFDRLVERVHMGLPPDRSGPSPSAYIEFGRYLPQLRRVCSYYSEKSLHVVLLEDFAADPSGTFRSVLRFIQVDEAFLPVGLGRSINAYTEFRSVKLRNLSRRFPPMVSRLVGRLNTVPSSYPPMDPVIRSKLLELFQEDNEALAGWLGRDLSAWRV